MFKSKIIFILIAVFFVAFIAGEKGLWEGRNVKCGASRIEGYKAYFLYSDGFRVPPEVETDPDKPCGHEFYYGLYQAATIFEPDMDRLGNICDKVNSRLPKRLWNGCYFNLGTSAVYKEIGKHPSWQEMVSSADKVVDVCNNLPGPYFHCAAGAYNGINMAYHNNPLLPLKENNPLIICGEVSHRNYEYQCMRNMVSFLYRFMQSNHAQAIKSIERMNPPPDKLQEIKITYFSSLAFEDEVSPEELTGLCLKFEGDLRGACIQGYVTGLVETAEPGKEPESIINFCLQSVFSRTDQGECLNRGFTELPSDDKVGECMRRVPKGLNNYCDNV